MTVGALALAACGTAAEDGISRPVVSSADTAGAQTTPSSTGVTELGARLVACSDVPVMTTDVIGDAVGGGNIDPVFQGVLLTYAEEHRDSFGGLWIDRQAGGTIVLAFTDDPDAHRANLAVRAPSADDVRAVEPPPTITDERPIGEWGVAFDVVQVTYTEDELVARIGPMVERLQEAGFPVGGAGTDITRNRVGIFLDARVTADALAAIERLLDDETDVPLDAVCLDGQVVDELPEPIESGAPLDVIVLPDAAGRYDADTRVECSGVEFPLGALGNLSPADEADESLRAVLDGWLTNEEGSNWPQDEWALLYDDGERAQFINIGADGVSFIGAEMGANGWIWSGASGGGDCDISRVLPEGFGQVEWELDPEYPAPDRDTTELHLLATERACTGGSELGERLLGPQVVETDDAVRVAFAAIPLTGAQNCPGNPSTSVVVTLDEPLGDRALLDGLVVGPIVDLVDG